MVPFFAHHPFHDDLGLWICSGRVHNRTAPRSTLHLRQMTTYNIAQVVKNDGWYYDGKHQPVRIKTGDVIITRPGFVHAYGGWPGPFTEDFLCFDGSAIRNMDRMGLIVDGIVALGTSRPIEPIVTLARNPSAANQLEANIRLQLLLCELYRRHHRLPNDEHYPMLEDLLAAIHRDPVRTPTIPEMAKSCGLSATHFRRLFLQRTGMSPKQYIDQLRIERAQHLLLEHHTSVTETARRLGFANAFHFSRRFKEIIGRSPQDYVRTPSDSPDSPDSPEPPEKPKRIDTSATPKRSSR
jgi:AraC-like DNA-binding protein